MMQTKNNKSRFFENERERSTEDNENNQGKQTTKGFKGGESFHKKKQRADLVDMSRKLKKTY